MNVLIYNDDDGEATEYPSRPIIPIAELHSTEPSLRFAKWYSVSSVNPDVVVGEILAHFQLISTSVAIERPMSEPLTSIRSDSVIRISFVSLRDIKFLIYAI